jgi:hypothetical protein
MMSQLWDVSFLPVIDATFVFVLMVIGLWLERKNGKHGILDEFLTPLPMGVFGVLALIEKAYI